MHVSYLFDDHFIIHLLKGFIEPDHRLVSQCFDRLEIVDCNLFARVDLAHEVVNQVFMIRLLQGVFEEALESDVAGLEDAGASGRNIVENDPRKVFLHPCSKGRRLVN